MDPGTAMIIASAIASAAKGAGDYLQGQKGEESSKRRAREMKRETLSGLFDDALQRSADLEDMRLRSRNRLGKSRARAMQDTSDLVRGAFNI